jgi:hypothetical protein
MAMNRRGFIKAFVAVPALAAAACNPAAPSPAWKPIHGHRPTLFNPSADLARQYREGALADTRDFEWYQQRYIEPAGKRMAEQFNESVLRAYRSENWCGTQLEG